MIQERQIRAYQRDCTVSTQPEISCATVNMTGRDYTVGRPDSTHFRKNARCLSFAGNANFSRLANAVRLQGAQIGVIPFDNLSGAFVT